MKTLKKISLALIAVCSLFLCTTFVSFAADGTLSFQDPTVAKGAEVTVGVKMEAGGAAIGDGNATLSYDTAKLEFVSGTNATGGNGTIELKASGTGTDTELNYSLVFKALEEGTASINVTGYTAYLYNDESLTLTTGSSSVTIGAGDGTSAAATGAAAEGSANATVNGTEYTIYEGFSDAMLLPGFTKTTLPYNGADRQCAVQDSSGIYMFYLNDANNDTHMALYTESSQKFSPVEEIEITNDFFILLSDRGDGSGLPSQFQATILTVGGNEFPTWQNTDSTDYYLVYALSSDGNEGYYSYDSKEMTYQRYDVPKESSTDKTKTLTGILGKIGNFIQKYLVFVLAAAAFLGLLIFILFIVLAVKIHHRNRELDELYADGYAGNADAEYDDDEYYEDDEYDDAEYEEDDDEYYDDDDEYDEYDDLD